MDGEVLPPAAGEYRVQRLAEEQVLLTLLVREANLLPMLKRVIRDLERQKRAQTFGGWGGRVE